MAKLILSMDGLVLKEIALTKERMSIGRRPSNDIQIDNLAISGEHAAVVTILNDSFLEDLNSTNGTLVNGQPVKKHFLKNGDVVELGKYKLKFIAEQAQGGAADYEKSGGMTPGRATPAPASAPAAAAQNASPPSAVLGAVQILNGANAGRELELVKPLTTLGKPAPARLFHYPCRRGEISHGEWPGN
ncbi:MAG: hypothetical protein H6R26_3504 [Proteobacteria bacterium]|nr:hypothetical protein [Pseudomonadota bacterium]